MNQAKETDRMYRVSNGPKGVVRSGRPVSDEQHTQTVEVVKDKRRAGDPPDEIKNVALIAVEPDQPESYHETLRVNADCDAKDAKALENRNAARARFAESGDPDDAAALDTAEKALELVQRWTRTKRAAARALWQRDLEKRAKVAERAEDLAWLQSFGVAGGAQ